MVGMRTSGDGAGRVSGSVGVDAGPPRLQGLEAVADARTQLVILGSFPGVASLRAQRYYAHPRNQFWPLLAALWPMYPLPPMEHPGDRGDAGEGVTAGHGRASSAQLAAVCPVAGLACAESGGEYGYAARCEWLLQRGLGLWDVYDSCQRTGSLDSAIRAPRLNDFSALQARCPQWRAVAHNGGESSRHAHTLRAMGLQVWTLPSSSPAYATWSFERKLHAWRAVMVEAGLLGPGQLRVGG